MSARCRLCDERLARVFVDLGMSPLSNAFLRDHQLSSMESFYPLRVYICDGCRLVQLPETARAEAIFDQDYIYQSSYSPSWVEHCRAFAAMAVARFGLGSASLVLEIASNDGCLLECFRTRDVSTLGIEPAAAVARVAAEERGIPTEVCFFGVDSARRLARAGRIADLICANNVLAHVPNLHDFVAGLPLVLASEGVITIEFPHLMKLIREVQFDTIYQEHYSYFTLASAMRVLEQHGLRVFDVDEISTHGGSLRVYACRRGAHWRIEPSVDRVLRAERDAALDRVDGYLGFSERVEQVKIGFLEFLIAARRRGERVAAYGAAAKGNTFLNYCGVRTDFIEFVVDRNARKQGRYLPGTHLPVFAPERLRESKPAYVVVLPWNLRAEILEQLSYVRSWGGKLVFAIPSLEIVA